jgi:hypothetical protein
VVVSVHKGRHPLARGLLAREWPAWVVRPVLGRAEQGFREGVVVGHPRPGEGSECSQLLTSFRLAARRRGTGLGFCGGRARPRQWTGWWTTSRSSRSMARATAASGQGVWCPDRASITHQPGPESCAALHAGICHQPERKELPFQQASTGAPIPKQTFSIYLKFNYRSSAPSKPSLSRSRQTILVITPSHYLLYPRRSRR